MTHRRQRIVVVALIAAMLMLTSCSSIPSSSKIQSKSATATSAPDQFIRVLARPPRANASPTEIVGGFLTASASFDDDHAVARTYLTETASSTWRPGVRVSVYDSNPGYGLAEFPVGKVRMLAFKSAGRIDARGQFAQPTSGARLRASFTMTKVAGQWRISGLANGLILSTGDVARAYRAINLYFLDTTGGTLVPDPVFLPTQQPGIATTVVRELLLGPTNWLAPAVRTGFPSGTKLAVDAVPVQDGIARVDLEPRAVVADGAARRALAAQLTYTLTQLPVVSAVRITLGGVALAIPGIGPISRTSDWPGFDPNDPPLDQSTYAIERGHLSVVTTSPTAVPGYFGTTRQMRAAATALDGRWIAASVRGGSRSVVRIAAPGAAAAAIVYIGRDVTAMSFDRLGSVWFADRSGSGSGNGPSSGSTMWTARSGRAASPVRVQGLAGRTIRSLKVSRDGARIALVVATTAGGPGELLLGRVQRSSGSPVVGGLRPVENTLTDVRDVAWADDATLLVVARQDGESVQTLTVGVDGDSVVGAGTVPALRSVAACPGRPLLAGTSDDILWVDRGSGWRRFVSGTTPIYPG